MRDLQAELSRRRPHGGVVSELHRWADLLLSATRVDYGGVKAFKTPDGTWFVHDERLAEQFGGLFRLVGEYVTAQEALERALALSREEPKP